MIVRLEQTLLQAGKLVEKLELSCVVDASGKWRTHFRRRCGSSLKLQMPLSHDLAIAFLGIYPRKIKAHVHTKTCTEIFLALVFIIDKNWKPPQCPATEWSNKLWCVHTWKISTTDVLET